MWYLYKDISWENELLPALMSVHWQWVALSFGFNFLASACRGFRWQYLLEPLGYSAQGWNGTHSVTFGYAMNYLIPRSGELARCTMLNKAEKVPVNILIGTVILERIVDVAILGMVIGLSLIIHHDAIFQLFKNVDNGKISLILYAAVGGLMTLIAFLMLMKRLRHIPVIARLDDFLKGMGKGIRSIGQLKKPLRFWLLTAGIWICWIVMTYLSMLAMDITADMSLADTIFFVAAGSLGMMVPTPGGAGSFHGMSILAFQTLGYSPDTGKIYSLLSWSVKTAFEIVVGSLGFLFITRQITKKQNQ
jgi:uncharacterized protein (TIRG00374 family)